MGTETTTAELTAQPTREQQIAALNSMQKGKEDSGYLSFEPGEEVAVVFLGWKEIKGLGANDGKTVPAVVLLTPDGEKINADSVIVSYFQKQNEGVGRIITCTGSKTTGNGTYKTFKFYDVVAPKKA
jgi:hypothetical protein